MTTQSQDIIERLERASGPDRELDARIWCAVNGYGFIAWDGAGCRYSADRDGWISSYYIKKWTASIDAALTLVPANHDWSLHADNGEAIAGCMPSSEDGCDIADCRGATPAIALCIAALKARASISSKEQVRS